MQRKDENCKLWLMSTNLNWFLWSIPTDNSKFDFDRDKTYMVRIYWAKLKLFLSNGNWGYLITDRLLKYSLKKNCVYFKQKKTDMFLEDKLWFYKIFSTSNHFVIKFRKTFYWIEGWFKFKWHVTLIEFFGNTKSW